MPMNQRLTEIYGTEQGAEADLEKLAAAELAEQLADEGGIDLASLDPETLEELTREVMGEESSSDQEKVTEADYLGRVMAHSYAQEMREIEKSAGDFITFEGAGDEDRPATGKPPEATKSQVEPEQAAKQLSEKKQLGPSKPADVSRRMKPWERFKRGVSEYHHRGGKHFQAAFAGSNKPGSALRRLAHFGKGVAHFTPHAGAGTLAAVGAYKALKGGKKKQSSAFDTLAEARALEILRENGLLED